MRSEKNPVLIRAFIQARMSSERFPAKVLAPLNGRPVIAHVVSRITQAIPAERITVATSAEESDDPLSHYVRGMGISVYRGSLEDVFARFRSCLEEFPCAWFFRICADSPLLDPRMLRTMLAYSDRSDLDLVTNIFPRTFPKGRSVEMLLSRTFAAIDPTRLSADDREHVTRFYYNHPNEFKIFNIASTEQTPASVSLALDTITDLNELTRLLQQGNEPQ